MSFLLFVRLFFFIGSQVSTYYNKNDILTYGTTRFSASCFYRFIIISTFEKFKMKITIKWTKDIQKSQTKRIQ